MVCGGVPAVYVCVCEAGALTTLHVVSSWLRGRPACLPARPAARPASCFPLASGSGGAACLLPACLPVPPSSPCPAFSYIPLLCALPACLPASPAFFLLQTRRASPSLRGATLRRARKSRTTTWWVGGGGGWCAALAVLPGWTAWPDCLGKLHGCAAFMAALPECLIANVPGQCCASGFPACLASLLFLLRRLLSS